jgi:hypothetical protein
MANPAMSVLPPPAYNFHVTKRPLRWLGAWRRTLKSVPLHASSHLNVLLSMFLFASVDFTQHFLFPTFPSCHVPSPPCAHADNEMARCVYEDTFKCPRLSTSYLRACLFIFILFLGDIATHISPFHRVRHSHYMHMSCGMPRFSFRPRYRNFRTPSYF